MDKPIFKPFNLPPLIIPSVYSETLEYQDEIRNLMYHMNELEKYVNGTLVEFNNKIDIEIDKKLQSFMDETNRQITLIQQEFSAFEAKIEGEVGTAVANIQRQFSMLSAELRNEFDTLEANVQGRLLVMQKQIEDVRLSLGSMIDHVQEDSRDYTNRKFNEAHRELMNQVTILEEQIENLKFKLPEIINPITGESDDIQSTIFSVVKFLRYGGLSAWEYDRKELTASQYDGLELTAIDYDIYGRFFINEEQKPEMTTSPFTGKEVSVKYLLNDLIKRLNVNGKTVSEYDAFEFTAKQFDDSTFGVYKQDHDKRYTNDGTPDTLNTLFQEQILLYQNDDPSMGVVDINLGTTEYDEYVFLVHCEPNYDGVQAIRIKVNDFNAWNIDLVIPSQNKSMSSLSRGVLFGKSGDEIIATTTTGRQGEIKDPTYAVINKIYGIKYTRQIVALTKGDMYNG